MPTKIEVAAKVQALIATVLQVDESDVQATSDLKRLGVDSLSGVDLMLAVEDGFQIEIPPEDEDGFVKLETVQDLINYCVKRLGGDVTELPDAPACSAPGLGAQDAELATVRVICEGVETRCESPRATSRTGTACPVLGAHQPKNGDMASKPCDAASALPSPWDVRLQASAASAMRTMEAWYAKERYSRFQRHEARRLNAAHEVRKGSLPADLPWNHETDCRLAFDLGCCRAGDTAFLVRYTGRMGEYGRNYRAICGSDGTVIYEARTYELMDGWGRPMNRI